MGEISDRAWLRAIARDVEEAFRLEDVIEREGDGRSFYSFSGWVSEEDASRAQDELDKLVDTDSTR